MGKPSTTKSTVENIETVEKMNEEKTNTKKTINSEPLKDDDEIEVVSLIPNVSYKDSKTGDMYEWDEVGHVEYITFETLKNMWRNNKGYFKNMWLKPKDNRVINKFGLTKTYENYEYLMEKSNYTKKNVDKICKTISETPKAMKRAVCGKIKNMVINEEISDAVVIRKLEKNLKLDLIEFL